jgi:hypothetical protein
MASVIKIRIHGTDSGIYVFDEQAQPKGAQHIYWWSMRENEMCAFVLNAPFFSDMNLVRNKDELFQAAEKYRQWSQKHLATFIVKWAAYWADRNCPHPASHASTYWDDADEWNHADEWYYSDSDERYDEGDMPSICDGYGDTGEGGWDYDDT